MSKNHSFMVTIGREALNEYNECKNTTIKSAMIFLTFTPNYPEPESFAI
jgi:hypothetical protein